MSKHQACQHSESVECSYCDQPTFQFWAENSRVIIYVYQPGRSAHQLECDSHSMCEACATMLESGDEFSWCDRNTVADTLFLAGV